MGVSRIRRIIHATGKKGTGPIISLPKSLHTFLIRELVRAGIILAPQDARNQTLYRVVNIIFKLGRVEVDVIP